MRIKERYIVILIIALLLVTFLVYRSNFETAVKLATLQGYGEYSNLLNGDKFYFVDNDASKLEVFNLDKLTIENSINLPAPSKTDYNDMSSRLYLNENILIIYSTFILKRPYGTAETRVSAINMKSNSILWTTQINIVTPSAYFIDNHSISFKGYDENLVNLDINTGKIIQKDIPESDFQKEYNDPQKNSFTLNGVKYFTSEHPGSLSFKGNHIYGDGGKIEGKQFDYTIPGSRRDPGVNTAHLVGTYKNSLYFIQRSFDNPPTKSKFELYKITPHIN